MSSEALDPKLAKALRGECEECTSPSHGDSGLCLVHLGKAATRQKRHRQRLADAGLCRDNCGTKVAKRHRPDRTVIPRRCPRCRRASHAQIRERRRGNGSVVGVTGDGADPSLTPSDSPQRGRLKLESGGDEWVRTRYVGRDRKGGPTREDKDRDIIKDAEYASAEIVKFVKAFALARSEEVAALPRVQRKAALRLAVDHARYAASFLDGIVEELGK